MRSHVRLGRRHLHIGGRRDRSSREPTDAADGHLSRRDVRASRPRLGTVLERPLDDHRRSGEGGHDPPRRRPFGRREPIRPHRGASGGVSITGTRDARIEGLSITGYHSTGPAFTPAGILVGVRHDAGHTSACFLHGDHGCGGICLLDAVSRIADRADSMARSRRHCGDSSVGAYGIAVLSYGDGAA